MANQRLFRIEQHYFPQSRISPWWTCGLGGAQGWCAEWQFIVLLLFFPPHLQFDLFEVPHPEHTFVFGGPVLLNTEAKRAERIEQEWHNKDGTYVDVNSLNVATESHTEVAIVGGMKVPLPFPMIALILVHGVSHRCTMEFGKVARIPGSGTLPSLS